MSEANNIFNQTQSPPTTAADPFAAATTPAAPDPFGYVPVASENAAPPQTPPPIDLGSQQTAAVSFETPAAPPAGTPSAAPAISAIDLGSQPGVATPFTVEPPAAPAPESAETQLRLLDSEPKAASDSDDSDEPDNPIEAALAKQEKAEFASIFAKPPIFEHASVKEPIENLDQTFEDLRVAKADDFPELEDGVRVTWNVTYGKITKSVPTPKKMKIGEFKKSIENSREFQDALKKDKNKSPDCVIKPRVTAQSKGEQRATAPELRCGGGTKEFSSYKALFLSIEDARSSGKVISIVPGRDGHVYEIRRDETGTYITPSGECKELSEIQAGFTPALPLVPNDLLRQILTFFRSVMIGNRNYEAIANILWDREQEEYVVSIPRQHVTSVRAESDLSGDYDSERYLHYMDVHSHNIMQAHFSAQDDRDEKATRLYAVIGKLNEFIPDMSVRISNGGKYLLIDPADVFESFGDYYPAEWNEQVSFGNPEAPPMRKSHECDDEEFRYLFRRLKLKGGALA